MRLLQYPLHLAGLIVAHPSQQSSWIPSSRHVEVQPDFSGVTWPWRVFKSSPHTPPNMTIIENGGELADGYIFMMPQTTNVSIAYAKENGGFIMTIDGDLVYGDNLLGMNDFRKQSYNGKDYLTYWTRYNTEGVNIGHGYGQVNFLDQEYQHSSINPNLGLNRLTQTANSNWSVDIHEQQMTPRNTLLVSAYNNTPCDLSKFGGSKDGWIVDGLVFELDIETEDVLFTWRASDHASLHESRQPFDDSSGNGTEAAPWDYFHVNSIEAVGIDYLINARHTWTMYMVSGEDGRIVWTLEGEGGGSFGALPSDGTFKWQHFARVHNQTDTSLDVALFDNHNQALDNGTGGSRGLAYHLKLPASKAYTPQLLFKTDTEMDELFADSQGSFNAALSNGNRLVGYGQLAVTREYGPEGDLRWQAQFGGMSEVQSYRAFKDMACYTKKLGSEFGGGGWKSVCQLEWSH